MVGLLKIWDINWSLRSEINMEKAVHWDKTEDLGYQAQTILEEISQIEGKDQKETEAARQRIMIASLLGGIGIRAVIFRRIDLDVWGCGVALMGSIEILP